MFKKLCALLLGASLLSACGNNEYVRAGTGAVLGAGAGLVLDGNPFIGAAAGGGIGYFTDRDTVDFGDSPIDY